MIVPVFKVTISTDQQGQNKFQTQIPAPMPPLATHVQSGDAIDNIIQVTGNHEIIDDIVFSSIPVQMKTQSEEVSIMEGKETIISFSLASSTSSRELLLPLLRTMKQSTIVKKYFNEYTLYIGRQMLQIFANFEDEPPITSSRTSSTMSSKPNFEEEEESDADSGVGGANPTTPSDDDEHTEDEDDADYINPPTEQDDDQFTVLWHGSASDPLFGDINREETILPDILTEDYRDDDFTESTEEDTEDRDRSTYRRFLFEDNNDDFDGAAEETIEDNI